jgi:hypothetical protein
VISFLIDEIAGVLSAAPAVAPAPTAPAPAAPLAK